MQGDVWAVDSHGAVSAYGWFVTPGQNEITTGVSTDKGQNTRDVGGVRLEASRWVDEKEPDKTEKEQPGICEENRESVLS